MNAHVRRITSAVACDLPTLWPIDVTGLPGVLRGGHPRRRRSRPARATYLRTRPQHNAQVGSAASPGTVRMVGRSPGRPAMSRLFQYATRQQRNKHSYPRRRGPWTTAQDRARSALAPVASRDLGDRAYVSEHRSQRGADWNPETIRLCTSEESPVCLAVVCSFSHWSSLHLGGSYATAIQSYR